MYSAKLVLVTIWEKVKKMHTTRKTDIELLLNFTFQCNLFIDNKEI